MLTQNTPSLKVIDPPAASPDPARLLDLWKITMLAEGLSPRTAKDWPLILARASKATGEPLTGMTLPALRYWLAGFSNANTRSTYHRAVVGFHRWLHREGYRDDDPTRLMRQPKQPQGIPHPCSTLGLQVLLASPMPWSTRVMVLLAAFEGLRVHEVAKVRGEEVDVGDGVLRVLGKGGKDASLPLHPAVAEAAASMPSSGWWFPGRRADRGGPILPSSVSCAIGLAMSRAGVASSAHGLRHWYGTALVRSGTDLRTVQTLLRHSDLNTTAIYVEVEDDARRAAVLRLPDVTGRGAR
jgi:site-specific recombinase XerD